MFHIRYLQQNNIIPHEEDCKDKCAESLHASCRGLFFSRPCVSSITFQRPGLIGTITYCLAQAQQNNIRRCLDHYHGKRWQYVKHVQLVYTRNIAKLNLDARQRFYYLRQPLFSVLSSFQQSICHWLDIVWPPERMLGETGAIRYRGYMLQL